MRGKMLLPTCCLALAWCAPVWCQEAPARLLDGGQFDATLSRLDEGAAVFAAGDRERRVLLKDLLFWGRPSEIRKGSYLLLADGGVVVGDITSVAADHIELTSARRPGLWKASRLPRKEVRAIVYKSSASLPERERFDFRQLSSADTQDRLLLTGGDSLIGTLLDSKAADEPDGAAPALRFLLPGAKEPLTIGQDRIVAAILAGRVASKPAASAGFWLGMADGSLVLTSDIKASDGSVTVALANGASLEAEAVDNDVEPPESFWSRVSLMQPLSPRVSYLSDLKTIGFKHVPLFDWQIDFANDRSVTHSRLRAGGERFVKGVGMPATSRLAYEVPAGASLFEAEIALDDEADLGGSVIFRVFLQSPGESWQPAYESKVVRGGDPPQQVRVELGEARRLALVVDMADHGDQRDWADWLNARFVK